MASGGDCAGNGADVRHLRIETKQAGIRGRADARRPHGKARLSRIGWVALAGLILAACSTSAPPGQNGKEYFSQKVYGKASPRRVAAGKPVPKGGGRYTVGRPYRVAGKTYIPSDNPRYSAIGLASWYGAAFHGRQTANGEIYDMNDLTAAHPTLPLPSYVRVTNLANGRSVVVRVNDRGPFARGRIIDVSKTAAGMLGFERRGTARVKVDYVGRANLDGHDRNMLMASYSQGGKRSSNGLFNAPSRGSFQIAAAAPVPRLRSSHAAGLALRPVTATGNPLVLVPAFALRPLAQPDLLAPVILSGGYVTSFAPVNPVGAAHRAAGNLAAGGAPRVAFRSATIIQLGAFADPANASRTAVAFRCFGSVETIDKARNGTSLKIVRLIINPRISAAAVIAAAAKTGLAGAFVVAR